MQRTFERRFIVRAPLARVRAFHELPDALTRLTPAPVRVRQAAAVAEGALARFTLYAPWPVRWVARHENVDEGGFDDVMLEGPFARWRHEHRYRAVDHGRTEVHDRVVAELRGPASRAIWAGMAPAFAYRAWATRRWCERG